MVTLVLYFGYKKRWGAPKTLLGNLGEFDVRLRRYVSDYRINVFEIAWLGEKEIRRFRSDFRIVADYFSQMRRTGRYVGSTDEIKHVKEIMELMTYLTRDTRFRDAYEERLRKGEEVGNMLEWIDELEEKGRKEGRLEGRQEGLEQGVMKVLISQSLKKFKRGRSVEEAADALETDPAEIAGIYAAIEECGADSTPEAIMDWMDGSKKKVPAGVL